MKKIRVLIVDDDVAISRLLLTNLKVRGYEVYNAANGTEALNMLEKDSYDLVVLDIMMPGIDGLEVCRRVREWSKVPIIILSAKGDERDKVKSLELGADDYVTKPFGINEVLARIKTALRHASNSPVEMVKPMIKCGDIEINLSARRVTHKGKEVKLTPIEFQLLQELAVNANKVLTHQMLLQKVWGEEYSQEREYLRVFVNRLRKKLCDDNTNPHYILTIPYVGYQFAQAE